jgi:hypothetical protein
MAFEIRNALENGSNSYAAMTHAICHLLTNNVVKKQNHHRSSNGNDRSATFAPKCYWHLRGPGGLLAADSRWGSILKEDSTGFRGFTSYAPLFFQNASDGSYSHDGLKVGLVVHSTPPPFLPLYAPTCPPPAPPSAS